MFKPKRKMIVIQPTEVSIVDRPANLTKFLVMKSDGSLEITISSDGTPEGTLIKVNGEEIKDLTSLNIWYNKPLPDAPANSVCGPALSCSYSRVVNIENGFAQTETFTLNKGDTQMNKELEALLKTYFGNKWVVKKADLSEDAIKALKEALALINKYKADFPEELTGAVGVLADFAASEFSSPVKAEETPEEKKKRLEAEVAAAAAKKGDIEKSDALTKSITELTKSVNDSNEANKKLVSDLTEITKRLEVVEKAAPGSNVITTTDDKNKGKNTDMVDHFPSIPM